MAVTIQIKRGLKSNLPLLSAGEMAFTTDEHLVYVGDGSSNYCVGTVASGTIDPSGNLVAGRLYINTTSNSIFFCNGVAWTKVGGDSLSDLSGSLDDIADGTNYQRVAAAEVDASGRVTRINDGTYIVSAQDASQHISDATKHRQIQDATISTTELWSSQKINDQISAVARGLDWNDSVITMYTATPPGGPTDGDRYIIPASGTGAWSAHLLNIAEYSTASGTWLYTTPNEGFATWVEDQDLLYIYTGAAWAKLSSATIHNDLSGLQGGTAGQFYHLTNTEYSDLTTNRTEIIQDIVGSFVQGAGGALVTYDDSSNILTVSGKLSVATPGDVSSSTSAAIGTSTNAARQDHSHNLGAHGHTSAADGGQINHSSLASIAGSTDGYHLSSSAYSDLVTNRAETVQDIVGGFITGAGSIVVAYNDSTNTLTVSGSGASYSHPLIGGDHYVSGLTAGWVVRATGASTYTFAALQSTDLPTHASRHQHGGDDEIATATPAANAIPKANGAGNLNSWISAVDGGTFT